MVSSTGEIRYLFNTKMQNRRLPCSCGNIPEKCSFWVDIWEQVDPDIAVLATRFQRTRDYVKLRLPIMSSTSLKNVANGVAIVYRSIATKSQAQVVIDSSKHFMFAYLLSKSVDIDLYILHFVRDPRGMVSS